MKGLNRDILGSNKNKNDKIDPQDFMIANDVWSSINNPVTIEMITGEDKSIINEDIIREEDGRYYIEKDSTKDKYMESYKLRQLHNYIKSKNYWFCLYFI